MYYFPVKCYYSIFILHAKSPLRGLCVECPLAHPGRRAYKYRYLDRDQISQDSHTYRFGVKRLQFVRLEVLLVYVWLLCYSQMLWKCLISDSLQWLSLALNNSLFFSASSLISVG